MNIKFFVSIFVLAAVLACSQTHAGEYIREQSQNSLIYDPNPAPGEVGYWSGSKDSNGYATGFGVLTWHKNGVTVSAYEGTKVRGKWTNYRKVPLSDNATNNRTESVGDFIREPRGANTLEVLVPTTAYPHNDRGDKWPRQVELPDFLLEAADYVHLMSCRPTKGEITSGSKTTGPRLNFFLGMQDPVDGYFAGLHLSPKKFISRGWGETYNGERVYPDWKFTGGITNDDIVSVFAYFTNDGAWRSSLPIRVSYRRAGQWRHFEGYCNHQGPSGKGTVGSESSNANIDGRLFGEFQGDNMVSKCSFEEFASAATMQSSRDNKRLKAAQEQVFGTVLAVGAITLGIYDGVGRKLDSVVKRAEVERHQELRSKADGEYSFRVSQLTYRGAMIPFIEVKDKDGKEYLINNPHSIQAQVGDTVSVTIRNGKWVEVFNRRTGMKSTITEVR